ncbi:MAG: GTPase domain-containing protein [Burkholderiales bacterium]|nr:GTPase domain-containing protein [Burkholderiales bacterium]
MSGEEQRIELSLVSHTNVGKTTLARSLLGREVGEVHDAAHVTVQAEPFIMVETVEGDLLRLWDTPGFGDSARLAARLAQSGNPIGWFLTQVWDRWRDRAFWSSQQAVRNVREAADVVLYLVSAAEDPQQAGYVEPEMRILEWIGKPAILLLNQAGPPRPAAEEEAEVERWRAHVRAHAFVRDVLTLDAFARFWVQEFSLIDALAEAVPEEKRAAFARLAQAWHARRLAQFDDSMRTLAQLIARVACDRELLPEQGIGERLRDVGALFGAGSRSDGAKARASEQLAQRYRSAVRSAADRLISIHGLQGRAAEVVLARVAENVSADAPVHEGRAAVVGGLVSGALSGLAADLASGGMTLGAGLLTGGLLGALGAAGLAHGFNLVRGADQAAVAWSGEFVLELVSTQLLTYLAVAHFGRGRGEWHESEHPPFWREAVREELDARRQSLREIVGTSRDANEEAHLTAQLHPLLRAAVRSLTRRLYPKAAPIPE